MICIDSDDEAAPGLQPPQHEVTPSDYLLCGLLVPLGEGATGDAGRQKQMLSMPGSFSLTMLDLGGASEIEIVREDHARKPVARVFPSAIVAVEPLPEEGAVLLRFGPPQRLGQVLDVGVPLRALALRPAAVSGGARGALATLRWWLPHAALRPAAGASPSGGSAPGAALAGGSASTLRLDGIELTSRELVLLEEQRCLNDSVVDFFLRLVVEVMAPAHLRTEMHVTSTFFFQKLTSGGVANGEEGWHNVRRWNRSIEGGMLAKRFVVVPINEQNVHWWLAVVCHPLHAMESPGGAVGSDDRRTSGEAPRIVCLDSATEPPPKGRTMGFLRGYLWREWCDRHPQALASATGAALVDAKVERTAALKAVVADVPKQANGYDCGIFIIEYLLHLLRSRSALASLGLAPHQHWFGQAAVSRRRKRLRHIAGLLQEEAKRRGDADVGRLLKDDALRSEVARSLQDQPRTLHLVQRPQRRAGCEAAAAREDGPPRSPAKRPRPSAGASPGTAGQRHASSAAVLAGRPASPPVTRAASTAADALARARAVVART